jgi:hypothetical protein
VVRISRRTEMFYVLAALDSMEQKYKMNNFALSVKCVVICC